MKMKYIIVLALIVVLAVASLTLFSSHASAQSTEPLPQQDSENEGPDQPITGEALEQASAAALAHLGEGRVTDTEVGDEEGYYEVEVTLADGRQVDVHLEENFDVLGHEVDHD